MSPPWHGGAKWCTNDAWVIERRELPEMVFHVEDQRSIEDLRLSLRVRFIWAEHHQNVLRSRQSSIGPMDDHALSVLGIVESMVSVNGEKRKLGNQPYALSQSIVNARIERSVVITRKGQYASRDGVHDISARSLHDNVSRKV